MKKILIPSYLLLLIGVILVIAIGNNKRIDIEFYTIKENHSYIEDGERYMTFNVISKTDKPIIAFPKLNSYQIKLDSQSFDLMNVDCSTIPFGEYFLIKIKAIVPDITDSEYISKSCNLIIINGSYKLDLDMGTFSIIDSNYLPQISVDKLSGAYNIKNKQFLAGINLTLSNKYNYLTQFRVGGMAYGILSRILFDRKLDNEIDINDYIVNYNQTKIEEEYLVGLKSKEMFIPLGYLYDYLIRSGYFVITLDGNSYYFDNWSYMTTDPSYQRFKDSLVKGEFKNA
jgi:hypothetical protein